MMSLALDILHNNDARPADHVAALWALARTHPARLDDPRRDDVIRALRDVAHRIQAMHTVRERASRACSLPLRHASSSAVCRHARLVRTRMARHRVAQADLMHLSSSPATTLVLLLSSLARLDVRPSSSLLDAVTRTLKTLKTAHTAPPDNGAPAATGPVQLPTAALLSLLKTCCFFGLAPAPLLGAIEGRMQRRVVTLTALDDEVTAHASQHVQRGMHLVQGGAEGSMGLDQVAQAVWLLGRVRECLTWQHYWSHGG